MDHLSETNKFFSDLAELLNQFEEQKKTLYFHYENLVNRIIAGRITEQQSIERVMDGLMDFGDDERFLCLYKRLCRYAFFMYPQMVGEHIHLFRLLFEENESSDKK